MDFYLLIIEEIINTISNFIWPLFLPFMLILGLYLSIKFIFKIQPLTSEKSKLKFKNIIGPTSISLGAMIGTGAIVGVLGNLSKLYGRGQIHIESMAMWGIIGSMIMVPVSYSEVVISKTVKMTPKKYIAKFISPRASSVYCISFVILYILGVGGFQFAGFDSVVTIITGRLSGIELTQIQRYFFIIIPIVIMLATIVLTKKHKIFINSLTYMICVGVLLYFIFFIIFIVKTRSFIPIFFKNMIIGMKNPVGMLIGVPAGFILGMQRVMQTSEPGIGAMAMAAVEADSEPREAGKISLIPTIVTIFSAICVTSYITSYGINTGVFTLPADGLGRLGGYFLTAEKVTGNFGLALLSIFIILSALTTLLGSYFFLGQLFYNSQTKNIKIYLSIILLAGTLAVFGFDIIFDIVDLLLFVVAAINMIALAIFVKGKWKEYEKVKKKA